MKIQMTGTIHWFDELDGFGMLKTCDGQSVVFYDDDLTLKSGDKVTFTLVIDSQWQQAMSPKKIGE